MCDHQLRNPGFCFFNVAVVVVTARSVDLPSSRSRWRRWADASNAAISWLRLLESSVKIDISSSAASGSLEARKVELSRGAVLIAGDGQLRHPDAEALTQGFLGAHLIIDRGEMFLCRVQPGLGLVVLVGELVNGENGRAKQKVFWVKCAASSTPTVRAENLVRVV
jgi:hypothetical protein